MSLRRRQPPSPDVRWPMRQRPGAAPRFRRTIGSDREAGSVTRESLAIAARNSVTPRSSSPCRMNENPLAYAAGTNAIPPPASSTMPLRFVNGADVPACSRRINRRSRFASVSRARSISSGVVRADRYAINRYAFCGSSGRAARPRGTHRRPRHGGTPPAGRVLSAGETPRVGDRC